MLILYDMTMYVSRLAVCGIVVCCVGYISKRALVDILNK